MLLFLFLIIEICKWVRVEEYTGDAQISPKTPIYLLKICGEGPTSKRKKRKIDTGKLIQDEFDSC